MAQSVVPEDLKEELQEELKEVPRQPTGTLWMLCILHLLIWAAVGSKGPNADPPFLRNYSAGSCGGLDVPSANRVGVGM